MDLGKYQEIFENLRGRSPVAAAVVYPCSVDALSAAMEAAARGFISPTLVGPEITIRSLAEQHNISLELATIISVGDATECARRSMALATAGEVRLLVRGNLRARDFLPVLSGPDAGANPRRRLSHTFVLDVPDYPKLLHLTDAMVHIAPDLATKSVIAQNAAGFVRALGVLVPKIAVLAASETVEPDLPATIDAAALAKMAERGQIPGAMVDGPLTYDQAVSAEAAKAAGIVSSVSGDADIILVPGLETGSALVRQLRQLTGTALAGVLLGAAVPVAFPRRLDDAGSRLVSTAMACAALKG